MRKYIFIAINRINLANSQLTFSKRTLGMFKILAKILQPPYSGILHTFLFFFKKSLNKSSLSPICMALSYRN